MATIDLKLKSYEELQFEIMNLTTKNYLQQQELDKYKNIVDELERYFIDMFNRTQDTKYLDDLQKLKELKGE